MHWWDFPHFFGGFSSKHRFSDVRGQEVPRFERSQTQEEIMKTLNNVEAKIVQSGTRIGGISNAVLSTVGLSLLCLFPLGLFSDRSDGLPGGRDVALADRLRRDGAQRTGVLRSAHR